MTLLRHPSRFSMPSFRAFCLMCGLMVLLIVSGCQKESPPKAGGPPVESPPATTKEAKATPLSYSVKEHTWKLGDPPLRLQADSAGFSFLSFISGNFAGFGEQVEVRLGPDDFWYLEGKGQQEGVAAKATSIESLTPALFRPRVKEYEWTLGRPPVKMLQKNEGVCYLSSVSGSFAGYGEEVRVRLAEDGYWYLEGHSGQAELKAKAIGLEWAAPGAAAEIKEHTWSVGGQPVRLLPKNEGFCFLASVSGSLAGGGEVLRVYLGDDGYWYLGGQSGQDALSVRAIMVRPLTRQ